MVFQSIDEVIQRLDEIIAECLQNSSPLGIFAVVYWKTTIRIKEGILAGRFENAARMERMDVIFASRYLDAYQQFLENKRPTQVWETAFNAAGLTNLVALQQLFLGMNAHINFDLGIAAAEAVGNDGLAGLEKDFFVVNDILFEQIDEMQDEISSISPLLFLLDWFGKRDDERFSEFNIKETRAFAWGVAKSLAPLGVEEKMKRIAILDTKISALATLIIHPGKLADALLYIVKWVEEKDPKKAILALKAATPK